MDKDEFMCKPHHAAISVANLAASVAWYAEFLGFELEKQQYLAEIPAQVAFLKRGDFRIELFEHPDGKALPSERRIPHLDLRTHGHKHLCLAVPDSVAAFRILAKKRADIVFQAVIDGSRMGFIRDNDGNLIELIEDPTLWNDEGIHA